MQQQTRSSCPKGISWLEKLLNFTCMATGKRSAGNKIAYHRANKSVRTAARILLSKYELSIQDDTKSNTNGSVKLKHRRTIGNHDGWNTGGQQRPMMLHQIERLITSLAWYARQHSQQQQQQQQQQQRCDSTESTRIEHSTTSRRHHTECESF